MAARMHPTPDKHGIAARHRVPPPRSGGPVGAQAKKNPAEAGFFVVRPRKRSEAELRRDAVVVRAAVEVADEVRDARRGASTAERREREAVVLNSQTERTATQ